MSHTWMSSVSHTAIIAGAGTCKYKWATTHAWTSHTAPMNDSWRTHRLVTSHVWMSHLSHKNQSRHTHDCLLSHIAIIAGAATCKYKWTNQWATSHIWMSHVTHMNIAFHTQPSLPVLERAGLRLLSRYIYIYVYLFMYTSMYKMCVYI